MPRPPRHASPAELLDAVRQQIAADPNITQTELRARVGGTASVVAAALRAVRVEAGLMRLDAGEQLDPPFADLIRKQEPPSVLDLRAKLPREFATTVAAHLASTEAIIAELLERMQQDAVVAMDAERVDARRRVAAADARCARAEEYVEELRLAAAEAVAETERVRTASAEERGRQTVEIAVLTRSLEEARSELAHAQSERAIAVAERERVEIALRDTREQAITLGRDLAAAGARVQELERQVTDLGSRLTRADGELAAARAAETEARAAAAAAQATIGAHEAAIARLEEEISFLRGSRDERVPSESRKRR